jgi:hypothetical protein
VGLLSDLRGDLSRLNGRERRDWLRIVTDLTDPALAQVVTRGVAYARSLAAKST